MTQNQVRWERPPPVTKPVKRATLNGVELPFDLDDFCTPHWPEVLAHYRTWVAQCDACGDVWVGLRPNRRETGCMRLLRPVNAIHWPTCPGGTSRTTCTCYDANGQPGASRTCEGTVKPVRPMRAAIAAYRLGGEAALGPFLAVKYQP